MKSTMLRYSVALLLAAGCAVAGPVWAQGNYLGEMRWVPYNFAPLGWATCDGQLLPIQQNTALFSLLGTTYGGDGITTFALPDLRGRVMIHQGQGPGTNHALGEQGGAETNTLSVGQMPSHSHLINGSTAAGTTDSLANAVPASPSLPLAGKPAAKAYGTSATINTTMNPAAVAATGGGQPLNNMQPYTTVMCIIALQGIFPARN